MARWPTTPITTTVSPTATSSLVSPVSGSANTRTLLVPSSMVRLRCPLSFVTDFTVPWVLTSEPSVASPMDSSSTRDWFGIVRREAIAQARELSDLQLAIWRREYPHDLDFATGFDPLRRGRDADEDPGVSIGDRE